MVPLTRLDEYQHWLHVCFLKRLTRFELRCRFSSDRIIPPCLFYATSAYHPRYAHLPRWLDTSIHPGGEKVKDIEDFAD